MLEPHGMKMYPIADVESTTLGKRINGGMPAGHFGQTALRKEQ
jgi:glutamate-1-semialdehyde aminotransferase